MRYVAGLVLLASALSGSAFAQVPQPFPRPVTPQKPGGTASAKPVSPPAGETPQTPIPAGDAAAPTEASLGLPIYPTAEFLASYDAGSGQRYYLFGTNAPFAQIVDYYRAVLKQRGSVLFDEPPVHLFEVGRFREESMAFPPGVTVKDYAWAKSAGYLNPKRGVEPARFTTIIQIVPPPAGTSR
jgi:hypothetical protein